MSVSSYNPSLGKGQQTRGDNQGGYRYDIKPDSFRWAWERSGDGMNP